MNDFERWSEQLPTDDLPPTLPEKVALFVTQFDWLQREHDSTSNVDLHFTGDRRLTSKISIRGRGGLSPEEIIDTEDYIYGLARDQADVVMPAAYALTYPVDDRGKSPVRLYPPLEAARRSLIHAEHLNLTYHNHVLYPQYQLVDWSANLARNVTVRSRGITVPFDNETRAWSVRKLAGTDVAEEDFLDVHTDRTVYGEIKDAQWVAPPFEPLEEQTIHLDEALVALGGIVRLERLGHREPWHKRRL